MIIRRNKCLLCGLELEPVPEWQGVQRHPESPSCGVTHTDTWGVALTDDEIKAFGTLHDDQPAQLAAELGLFDLHPPVEAVLGQMFEEHGLPRLGGPSTGRGWSSFAVMQRCPYLFKKRYVERQAPPLFMESASLAIGTLIHTFLALHYANMMGDYAAITPEVCHEYLRTRANPAYVAEGWRVFMAYRLYYAFDDIQPLAIEHDLQDPRTGESCRYDMIGFAAKAKPSRPAGTYLFEHKSAGRFDFDTLEGWANDGEVIGEAALWRRLGLDKRFGPLRGVIVNLLGKQKEPKFHRTTIAPDGLLIKAHLDDLRRWEGLIQLCRATDNWPRSRANCIGRFGRCDWWEHCVSGAP